MKLGAILVESKEEVATSDPNKRIRVRLNVQGVEKRPETNDVKGATKYYTRRRGQFIYGKQNLFKGAFGVIPPELDGFESSSDLPAFDVNESCNPEWIYYFLRQGRFYEKLVTLSTGTGSRRVQPKKLYNLMIPLPERKVQEALILRFHVIETKKRDLDDNIREIQGDVNSLRQAILLEAVSGKLVPQDQNDEPASELLQKIRFEKERLAKAHIIKKGTQPQFNSLAEADYEIPTSWIFVRLNEICSLITDGTHQTPNYTEKGKPFLSAQNIKPFRFMPQNSRYVSEADYRNYIRNKKPELDDILLTRVGAGIGEAAVIDKEVDFALYVSLALIKTLKKYVSPYYLVVWLNSPIGREKSSANTYGVGHSQGNLNLSLINDFLIPLPPLNEQKRIVAKVRQLLTLCDELENRVVEHQKGSEFLMEDILREAFTTS